MVGKLPAVYRRMFIRMGQGFLQTHQLQAAQFVDTGGFYGMETARTWLDHINYLLLSGLNWKKLYNLSNTT
jgi:hypothetical protein